MRHVPAVAIAALALLWPTLAKAQLDPEKVARIRHEEKAAMARIAAEHGNKKPGEMDNDERREVMAKQQAAAQAVLDKEGVSPKEWVSQTSRMSRDEQAQAATAEKRLEAEAKAKKAAAAKKEGEKGPVQVQQGFGEGNPVDLEAAADAPPKVEEGIPVE